MSKEPREAITPMIAIKTKKKLQKEADGEGRSLADIIRRVLDNHVRGK